MAIYTVTLCRNLVLAWGRVQLRGEAIEGLANWAQGDRGGGGGGAEGHKGTAQDRLHIRGFFSLRLVGEQGQFEP